MAIPVFGYPNSLAVHPSENLLYCDFPSHRAIALLAQGEDFLIERQKPLIRLLKCRLDNNGEGILSEGNSQSLKFTVPAQHPDSNCIAFIRQTKTEGAPLTLIAPDDTLRNISQCQILSGGRVKASPQLAGSTFQARVEIVIPAALTALIPAPPIPPGSIQVHALSEPSENITRQLITFKHSDVKDHSIRGSIYTLTLSFSETAEIDCSDV